VQRDTWCKTGYHIYIGLGDASSVFTARCYRAYTASAILSQCDRPSVCLSVCLPLYVLSLLAYSICVETEHMSTKFVHRPSAVFVLFPTDELTTILKSPNNLQVTQESGSSEITLFFRRSIITSTTAMSYIIFDIHQVIIRSSPSHGLQYMSKSSMT